MPHWTLRTAGAALTILVAACGSPPDPAQTGVSAKEDQQLNDAATMLDDNGQDAVVASNDTDADTGNAPDNGQ